MRIGVVTLSWLVVTIQGESLNLVARFGRQLGGSGEGGVALGLVSALQQWSDSLETKTEDLRSPDLQEQS